MSSLAYIFVVLMLVLNTKVSNANQRRYNYNCSMHRNAVTNIGVVINGNTRVGKEQKIAMKIAVRDLYSDSCSQITLHFRDFSHSSLQATSVGKSVRLI